MNASELTIERFHEMLVKREATSEELTREYLSEIRRKDGDLRAFLEVRDDAALETSRKTDEKVAKGDAIPMLAGAPGAVKDNILVKGFFATAASNILKNYSAPYDATVIKNLRLMDAVILGKTNMDEFAMGSSTENSAFGPTKNPHDVSRVPGGSSGGSAAAVASGECLWALGSDTGGSVRQPAGFCGVVGLKPTYGAVSRYGLIAMASSLDQIGPFAKTVKDAAIVFEAIAGHDPMDSTSVENPGYRGLANEIGNPDFKIKGLKVGFPREYFSAEDGIDKDVGSRVRAAIEKLEKLGAGVEEISLPHTSYALACYYIIQSAEVSSNLARYDGMKYGHSVRDAGGLTELYFKTRGEGFGLEVRRRILLGTYVLSAGYYDAYYAKAQKVRRLIKNDFLDAFKKVDVLVAPTSPTLPFKFGERTDDPVSMYLADVYTVSMNLAGLPALSLPCGKVGNLPVGVQIIGKPFAEKTILQTGHILEQALA